MSWHLNNTTLYIGTSCSKYTTLLAQNDDVVYILHDVTTIYFVYIWHCVLGTRCSVLGTLCRDLVNMMSWYSMLLLPDVVSYYPTSCSSIPYIIPCLWLTLYMIFIFWYNVGLSDQHSQNFICFFHPCWPSDDRSDIDVYAIPRPEQVMCTTWTFITLFFLLFLCCVLFITTILIIGIICIIVIFWIYGLFWLFFIYLDTFRVPPTCSRGANISSTYMPLCTLQLSHSG